jgi:sugar phosphate isomerase/epimerase
MPDRLAASTNCYHPYSLEEALAGIAGAGFTSVEINSVPGWTEHIKRDADAHEIARVRDLLEKHGLTVVSLSAHSDLTSDAGADRFRQALSICERLGIPMITTSSGGHDASSAGEVSEQRERFLAHMDRLCDEAASLGVTICLETHGELLATGAIAAQVIRDIGKPNVGINYDPANVVFYDGTRPETDIAHAAPYVVHMHVKDQIGGRGNWNFPAVGTGEIDFKQIFSTLDAAGFNGPCSIEIEFTSAGWPPIPEINAALETSYAFVRQFVAKG